MSAMSNEHEQYALLELYTAHTESLRCTCHLGWVKVHLNCVLACRDTDVHTVASLLKLYLRELPEPVVPWTQYQDFLDCTNILDSNTSEVDVSLKSYHMFTPECVTHTLCVCESPLMFIWLVCPLQGWKKLEKQIALLPRFNYNLLSYVCRWVEALNHIPQSPSGSTHQRVLFWDQCPVLTGRACCVSVLCRFLFEVQQHSSVNKMNVENLATVMGINLLKPQIEDPITVMKGEHALLAQLLEAACFCDRETSL